MAEQLYGDVAGVAGVDGCFEGMLEALSQLYTVYTRMLTEVARIGAALVRDQEVEFPGRVSAEVGTVAGARAVKLTFDVLPAPFNRWFRLDAKARWSVEANMETRALWESLVAQALPYFAGVGPFERATLFLRHVRPRRLDPDALDYTVKFLVDALVVAGLLAGDSQDHLRYAVEVVVDPSSEGRVEALVVEGFVVTMPQMDQEAAVTKNPVPVGG